MNSDDKEYLKIQEFVLNAIKETHYRDTTYQAFNDSNPASFDSILRINKYFFESLKKDGIEEIDEWVNKLDSSLYKVNKFAFDNKYTPRQVIKLLHTKYIAVTAYMYGGDLDGKIEWKKIVEIVESTSIN